MRVHNLTPMIPVADIDEACRFMTACLGFKTVLKQPEHAYCERDGGAIRMVRAPADADMDDPARQLIIYIDVDDADAFFGAHRDALEALPSGHFRPPFDRDYGQREFHAIHGPFLFMVGHKIREDS